MAAPPKADIVAATAIDSLAAVRKWQRGRSIAVSSARTRASAIRSKARRQSAGAPSGSHGFISAYFEVVLVWVVEVQRISHAPCAERLRSRSARPVKRPVAKWDVQVDRSEEHTSELQSRFDL